MINTYKLISFLIALMMFGAVIYEQRTASIEEIPVAVEEQVKVEELNILDQATRVGKCTVTYYCICEKCCGKSPDHPAYGITKSGRTAIAGISVAVDESIIPLGSKVIIDYGNGDIRYHRADDTGSMIKGNRIDVCVWDHQKALELGKKTAMIYYMAK